MAFFANLSPETIGVIGGADGPTAIWLRGSMQAYVLSVLAAVVIGYLLGSILFGVVFSTKVYKDDVRTHGSGNAGSTNVLRTYGKGLAILTLLGDMGKGALAVVLARLAAALIWQLPPSMAFEAFGPSGLNFGAVAALAALFGHYKPLYFRFKGGKGVAVAAGTILVTNPLVFLLLLLTFVVTVAVTRIVSLSSITAAAAYPVYTLLVGLALSWPNLGFNTAVALLMGGFVIWLHRENIQRLKDGTEYRFGSGKKG